MKRPVFIIVGIIIVLILFIVWVYMLFFKTPVNPNDSFADFNFGDTTDTSYTGESGQAEEVPVVDVSSQDRLRQLTTKPVIGFSEFTKDASSTPQILYAEAGTGHIYSIDLKTGEEVRLSGTTIPSSQEAEISPNGQYIMYRSGEGVGSRFLVGTISSTSQEVTTFDIEEPVISFSASTNNTFLYAIKTTNSTIGKEYNPVDKISKTLFTLPFRDATIDWGDVAAGPHFAYPKTTSQLESFLFEIDGSKTTRLPVDGYGMSASGNQSFVIFSKQTDAKYKTFFYNQESMTVNNSGLIMIPEKCEFSQLDSKMAICAQSFVNYGTSIPDVWYSGELSFADSLWEINGVNNASLLVDTEKESGRELDIIDVKLGNDDANIYFVNKNDKALWLYERIQNLAVNE